MNLIFKKVVLHNFLSIGDATVTLDNQGYVLVTGRNENIDDNSLSNGSGKSSIFEAISWCLTGETIRGTKDIVNINGDDGAYVGLEFVESGKVYKILRSKNHSKYKTNLTIQIDGVNKSGKGIRDSEKLLAEYLPDLTTSLLGSVVILGQGLPQRFTNNTPAGRKEVLEKLSKSDFMIEDIKNRITSRKSDLQGLIRKKEDEILEDTSKKSVIDSQTETLKSNLFSMDASKLDEEIKTYTIKVSEEDTKINQLSSNIETKMAEQTQLSQEYTKFQTYITEELEKIEKKYPTMQDIDAKYPTALAIEAEFPSQTDIAKKYPTATQIESKYAENLEALRTQQSQKYAEALALSEDIKHKDSVVDVCPTCGQKLAGIVRIDTTPLKQKLAELKTEYGKISEDLKALESSIRKEKEDTESKKLSEQLEVRKKIQQKISEVEQQKSAEKSAITAKLDADKKAFSDKISEQRSSLLTKSTTLTSEINNLKSELNSLQTIHAITQKSLMKATLDREQFDVNKKKLEEDIKQHLADSEKLSQKILYNTNEKDTLNSHLDVVIKFETSAKRDFRGFLLVNVIDFIRNESKKYSMDVFGTDKIDFTTEGNNINIGYNGKEYSSLSGGEKQKVDLIVQFAIRKMLCQYLGFSSNLLIVDEIFDNLDSKGCEKVVNLISNKLFDISSIFIVTHHRDIEIPCDRELTVVKSSSGVSRIE